MDIAHRQKGEQMDDLISRQAAIDALEWKWAGKAAIDAIKNLPSAQPERLTDDDFETIRIHLNAYKEKLCNQHRWKEAEEYQRIIDRFMSFTSAQPEPCEDVVSRADVIELVKNSYYNLAESMEDTWSMVSDVERLPSAQPEDWMERNKERILQAGMEGREIEFRIGGRLFAIREKAQ